MDFHEPEDFLQSEWFDMEEDRGIVRRQRIYRRLMLSCGVYHTAGEDKDDDFGYIRNYRRNIENDFQSLFPCQLHVHSSSAFLVLEEDCSMGKVFPKTHAYYDLLLIVHDDLRKRVKSSPSFSGSARGNHTTAGRISCHRSASDQEKQCVTAKEISD